MGFIGSVVKVLTNPASLVTDKIHDALPGGLGKLSLGHLADKAIRDKITDGVEGGLQKLSQPQQGSDGIEEDPNDAAIKARAKKLGVEVSSDEG